MAFEQTEDFFEAGDGQVHPLEIDHVGSLRQGKSHFDNLSIKSLCINLEEVELLNFKLLQQRVQ